MPKLQNKKIATHLRYFVPDLTPEARIDLVGLNAERIFVAESPHVCEIAPEDLSQRRPLCGAAGKKWWAALTELLELQVGGKTEAEVSLERQLFLAKKMQFFLINAVQFPMDPKITARFPAADPLLTLGFSKGAGEYAFKKKKQSGGLTSSLDSLRKRLFSSALVGLPIFCLGNDADWFVRQALGETLYQERVRAKIPHPSAWWRRGGYYGQVARSQLAKIFANS